MNERLKQLIVKASVTYNDLYDYARRADEPCEMSYQEVLAKMIIEECANIAQEQKSAIEAQIIFNSADEFWNKARTQQCQDIFDKIKQHFEVE